MLRQPVRRSIAGNIWERPCGDGWYNDKSVGHKRIDSKRRKIKVRERERELLFKEKQLLIDIFIFFPSSGRVVARGQDHEYAGAKGEGVALAGRGLGTVAAR